LDFEAAVTAIRPTTGIFRIPVIIFILTISYALKLLKYSITSVI